MCSSDLQRVALIKQDPLWSTFDTISRTNWRTFKMNRKLVGNQSQGTGVGVSSAAPSYRRLTAIADVTVTPLLFDGRCEEVATSSPDRRRFDGWEVYVGRRHSDAGNILFTDGHAELWRKGTINTAGGWVSGTTTLSWWVE